MILIPAAALLALFLPKAASADTASTTYGVCNCTSVKKKVAGVDCVYAALLDTSASASTMFYNKVGCPKGCIRKVFTNQAELGSCQDYQNLKSAEPDSGGKAGSGSNLDHFVKLNNPLEGNETDVTKIVGNIIKAALGIMGALVLLMIVWGGFRWLTAMGNSEKVKAGGNTIMWAVLGAVVVLASYMLLNIILNALAGK